MLLDINIACNVVLTIVALYIVEFGMESAITEYKGNITVQVYSDAYSK